MQKYKEKLRIQQLYQENHIIYRIQSKKNGTMGQRDIGTNGFCIV